jgi:hypothetical protein
MTAHTVGNDRDTTLAVHLNGVLVSAACKPDIGAGYASCH